MRTIDVRDYKVGEAEYRVKDGLIAILMHPELRLSAVELLKRNRLGQRILDAIETIKLEEEDYTRLKGAVEGVTGFSRADVELVQRVLEAPEESL
jgi:hypothetical protein